MKLFFTKNVLTGIGILQARKYNFLSLNYLISTLKSLLIWPIHDYKYY